MKLCFFDDVTTGHHTAFASGLAEATVNAGASAIVASPSDPNLRGVEWVSIPEGSRSRTPQGRKVLRTVTRFCRDRDVDLFVDLNLDKNIWILPASLGRLRTRIHVLHHVTQYVREVRTKAERGKTRYLRSALKRLAARGDSLVVHTAQAAEILGEMVPSESILELGYPIRVKGSVDHQVPQDKPKNPVILFVGQARREKGLSDLLSAAALISKEVTVRVVGPQKPEVRRELEERFTQSSVVWVDKFVDESELDQHYRSASLVATPYRTSFAIDGGASGVLLEALAHGKPLLTTTAVSRQLPTDYSGAVVVEADDVVALSDGIHKALEDLPHLTSSAESLGPVFVNQKHSYESYVAHLVGKTW